MDSILVAGDICPHNRTKIVSDIKIDEKVEDIIGGSSFSIVNLECPCMDIASGRSGIHKQGPCLSTTAETIEFIKKIGFNCVTLANNHIMDYGADSLIFTIKELEKSNIHYVGAGKDINVASTIKYINISDRTIAIVNACEHEFSIANIHNAGANPLNPIFLFYQIQEAKKRADYIILIIHGGIEHYQYPTKRMVDTYRFFIDAGADTVINHHQHCPCGFEVYKGKPIYYGLGNFCFDWDGKRNSIWNLGYMVRLNLTNDHQISSEIIPYRQCDKTPTVDLLEGEELAEFNIMMKNICEVIQDEKLLLKKFEEFNAANDFLYKKMLEPYSGRIANGLYLRGLLPTTISKERILALMDFIICESHQERVIEYLERLYKQYFNE